MSDAPAAPNPYDLVPYESQPIAFTGPEHMAICALLAGGPCPPVERFRYLELGCADGGNLLPLAFHHPESFFVGIDSSEAEVQAARELAQAIGITNVRFEVADVRAIPKSGDLDGPFDYIVAHGIYSWVPEDARAAILDCARERLTLDGLAYVSYNVCPGWKVRGVVRDLAVRAAAAETEPHRRLTLARAAAQRLLDVVADDGGRAEPWPRLLRHELEKMLGSRPAYVLHEYLADHNQPFYFHEFVEGAEARGLVCVGDAMGLRDETPDTSRVYARLEAAGLDGIDLEQAADLACDRAFRATLLCRDDVPRGIPPGPDAMDALFIAGRITLPTGEPRLAPDEAETFGGSSGVRLRVESTLAKAALRVLDQSYPRGLRFDELVARAEAWLAAHGLPHAASDDERQELANDLLVIGRHMQIELRLREPPMCVEPGPRPRVVSIARAEATRGYVTSPVHHKIELDLLDRFIVELFDGARLPDDVTRDLTARIAAGEPQMEIDGEETRDPARIEPIVAQRVGRAVHLLAAWGLFAPV